MLKNDAWCGIRSTERLFNRKGILNNSNFYHNFVNKTSLILVVCLTIITVYCPFCEAQKSGFVFKKTDQGIELAENGRQVFFYQNRQKTLSGTYICNNYIHPLYSLDGDTLTEESPADHPYHRGV